MPLSIKNLLLKNTQNKFVRRKGYLYCTNKCLRVLDGLVFRRLNFLISLHPRLFHFFQFSDLPLSSVRSGYHGVTFNQDRGHQRDRSFSDTMASGPNQTEDRIMILIKEQFVRHKGYLL